jgi:hypothetical protein
VHRIGPGPLLQYRPSRFRTAPASSDRTLSRRCFDHAAVSRPRQRASDASAACRCCLHVPTMQRARIAFARHAPELIFPSSSHCRCTPEHPRTAAAESTTAPLRSVTPHPKPATVLPADPSTGTIDLSSSRSSMAPLRPSCRERLHVHRCLRSPSDPTGTSPSWALGLCCSLTRKPSSSTACAAQHRRLTPARACRCGG